jgi:hypothetical protein
MAPPLTLTTTEPMSRSRMGWMATEAIGLYQAAGYREVVAFNNEPYADHWFEKTLDHSTFPDAEPA